MRTRIHTNTAHPLTKHTQNRPLHRNTKRYTHTYNYNTHVRKRKHTQTYKYAYTQNTYIQTYKCTKTLIVTNFIFYFLLPSLEAGSQSILTWRTYNDRDRESNWTGILVQTSLNTRLKKKSSQFDSLVWLFGHLQLSFRFIFCFLFTLCSVLYFLSKPLFNNLIFGKHIHLILNKREWKK